MSESYAELQQKLQGNLVSGAFAHYAYEDGVDAYLLVLGVEGALTEGVRAVGYVVSEVSGCPFVKPEIGEIVKIKLEHITEVWRASGPENSFGFPTLKQMERWMHGGGPEGSSKDLVFTRPSVVEMTVDEISEKLGFPVKVVGGRDYA